MKIDVLKTMVITLIMVLTGLLLHVLPGFILIIAPFLLLPVLYLYMKSRRSYYVMSAIVVIFAIIFLNFFAFQVILATILAGNILGQLLTLRASKERMLFILTTLLSLYTLLSIIMMQLMKVIPTADVWFSELKDMYAQALDKDMPQETLDLFYRSLDVMQLQIPGVIIFIIFLLSLVALLVTMPLLRKFKISTPNFRPLYFWQMPKIVFYMYLITIIVKLFTSPEDVVLLGIVINLEYVLEWIIFIQGLSLISFYVKAKQTPVVVNVLMFIFAFIMAPITQLLGMIDLIMNIKARIRI